MTYLFFNLFYLKLRNFSAEPSTDSPFNVQSCKHLIFLNLNYIHKVQSFSLSWKSLIFNYVFLKYFSF